jgi:membrane protein involved in colicin uptake
LRSEQMANSISLQKEKIELGQSEIENLNALAIEQKKFTESLETNEVKKLQNQRANLEEEKRIELERLQVKIDSAVAGTQARVDAENEYAVKKQEIDNALVTNQIETNKAELAQAQAVADAKKAIQDAGFNNVAAGIGLLKTLFEKNKGLQKALLLAESAAGIAKIVVNTQAANAAATLKYALLPGGVALAKAETVMNNISAGIGIAANVAATAKGLAALGGGGGASGGSSLPSGGGGGGGAAPQFNVVGNSGVNQLANVLNTQEQTPVKAYVVPSDVTTGQSLDRNIIRNASLG